MAKTYEFRIKASEELLEKVESGATQADIINTTTEKRLRGEVKAIAPKEKNELGQISKIFPYFLKQFKAIIQPLVNSQNRQKYLSISLIYAILNYSMNLGRFFVRGWRLGVIRNMGRKLPIIAPNVQQLYDVGFFMKEGIILIFTKFIYDLPKYLLLVVFGYEIIEFFMDFGYWIFQYNFTDESRLFFAYAKDEGLVPKLGTAFLVQFLLFIGYSLIVSPTFKIQAIKYAFHGNYARFFNPKEMLNSYKAYRSMPRATLAAYTYGIVVSTVGNFISFILLFIPLLGLIVLPFYRFAFIHWPKAHAYGGLARKLIEKGVVEMEVGQESV